MLSWGHNVVAEFEPPPLGSWTGFAFIQGPLVEEIGEFLGRVVPVSRGVDFITRVLPLPFLQKVFKKTREASLDQQKQDGQRVIKVHTAIQIVESWLGGLTGTAQEIVDLLHEYIPAPGTEGRGSLLDRICDDLRRNALGQRKHKYILRRPPTGRGPNKGFATDWTRRAVGDHRKKFPYQPDSAYPAPVEQNR